MVSITDEWGFTERLLENSEQYKNWYQETVDAFKETLALIADEDFEKNGWKVDSEDKTVGDKVFVKNIDKRGKTFALTGIVEGDVKHVFDINYYQYNDKPHWNPTIAEYNNVLNIGSQTSIIYWAANEILGGLVSSRDFVDARGYRIIGDSYIMAGKGTVYDKIPEKKGRVRGLSGANILKMTPCKDKPGFTKITWMMSNDLKGMIPKAVTEKAMHFMMLEYMKQFRIRLTKPAIIN